MVAPPHWRTPSYPWAEIFQNIQKVNLDGDKTLDSRAEKRKNNPQIFDKKDLSSHFLSEKVERSGFTKARRRDYINRWMLQLSNSDGLVVEGRALNHKVPGSNPEDAS